MRLDMRAETGLSGGGGAIAIGAGPVQPSGERAEVCAPGYGRDGDGDGGGRGWVGVGGGSGRGSGVAAEVAPQLFERFVTGGLRPGKSGLGLFFCRITVERWGGSIGYEGRTGEGARFRVRLRAVGGQEKSE